MSEQVFGKLFSETDLELAVIDTLTSWFPDYLAEVERQHGLDPRTLPLPKSYSQVNDFVEWSRDPQLPTVLVISPGMTEGKPKRQGDGSFTGRFRVGVAAIVTANGREAVRRISGWYGAVITGAIMQHQTLGGVSSGVMLGPRRRGDLPDDAGRTLGSIAVTFEVEVPNIVNASLGYLTPRDEPYTDITWPTADPVEVTVEGKE